MKMPRILPRFPTTECSHWRRRKNGFISRYFLVQKHSYNWCAKHNQGSVNNDDQFTRKTVIPQDKFLDLVNLVLTTTWYTFNSQFYQQTDGVAMGGPTSSTTAEIYMQAHEHTQYLRNYVLQVWEQFTDDVYSILKTYALGKLFPSHQQSSSKY